MSLNVDLILVSPLNDTHSMRPVYSSSPHVVYPLPVARVGLWDGTDECLLNSMAEDRRFSSGHHSSSYKPPFCDTKLLVYFHPLFPKLPVPRPFSDQIEPFLPNELEQKQVYGQQMALQWNQHKILVQVNASEEAVDAHMC